MNKLIIPVVVASAFLAGCVEDSYVPSKEEIEEESRKLAAQDALEIQERLKEMKAADPSIRDAYYSFNDNGEKELHVIREENDGVLSSTIFPAAIAGLLVGQLMSNGFSAASSQHSVGPRTRFSADEERERKSGFVASPGSYASSANSSLLTKRSAARSSGLSTRSSAFSSGSSVRAGGYSSGG